MILDLIPPAVTWAIFGVLLIIIELMTFTFILCFLGAGALAAALTAWLGLTPGLNGQLAVFAVASILTLFLLRKTAKKLFAGHHDLPPDYLGQKVKVIKTIPNGGEGAIAYRGSEWYAFSDHAETIPEGAMVEIIAIEGIRAKVKPL